MSLQVILDSSFARPGSAPIFWAGRKESSGTGLTFCKLFSIFVITIFKLLLKALLQMKVYCYEELYIVVNVVIGGFSGEDLK